MVILIGGSSHVGKTLVSQELIKKLGYPCMSMDHLKMGFIRTGRTSLTVNDDYKMRFFLWPYVAEIIKTAIENNQNLIIEGCYIPVNWKESFSEQYLSKILCKFIVMSEDYLRLHAQDIEKYSNVAEKRLHDEINIERLINCSKEFKEDCISNDTPCIEISEEFDLESLVSAFLPE